jgi:hypothetical protein
MSKPGVTEYLSDFEEKKPTPQPRRQRVQAEAPKADAPAGRKVRVTLYLGQALHQEARTAALAIGAKGGEPATLSALFDEALLHELERLRRLHNGGKAWTLHLGRLGGGRPPKRRTT